MEEKKEKVENMTVFAQEMQAENNMLMQAMSDEQLCEIVSNCIDELEKREYSVVVAISNPDNPKSTIYMDCSGVPRHLASSLMYLSVNRKLFSKVVCVVADKLTNDRAYYEKLLVDNGLELDEQAEEEE